MQQGFGQGGAGYGQPQQAGAPGFGQNQAFGQNKGQNQGMPNGDQQAAPAAPTFVDPFSGLLPGLGSALPSVRPLRGQSWVPKPGQRAPERALLASRRSSKRV